MEEKIGKTSVSRPGDLSEGEIDANVKAILDDSDVEEILAKIGISKGEAYQELANKKFILPKKSEDEVSYAKRYIKFQVLSILMDKYNEKIFDDTTEKAKEAWQKLALQHNTNLRRGDVNAIIAMIETEYLLPSKDGKTAKPLTQKQRDIIVNKLREGIESIEEILEAIEFEEYEDKEVDSLKELEDVNEDKEPEQEENKQEENEQEPGQEEKDNLVEEEAEEQNGEQADDFDREENGIQNDIDEVVTNNVVGPENLNYKEVEIRDEKYFEEHPEDRDAKFYTPPANSTIEIIARELNSIKNSGYDEKVIVVFHGIMIDPQKYRTPTEMIEDYEKQSADRDAETRAFADKLATAKTNSLEKTGGISIDEELNNVTHAVLGSNVASSKIQGVVQKMEKDAKESGLVVENNQPDKIDPDKIDKVYDDNNTNREEDDGSR